MKRVVVMLLLTVTMLTATSCSSRNTVEKNGYNRFKKIAIYKDGYEVVDQDTGIGYFVFYNTRGAVVLYDEQGNLYRPNGWRDYGE